MIVTQNSNLKQHYISIETKEKQPPLLLKPTGVPVFTPVDSSKTLSQQDNSINSFSEGIEGQSTMETSNQEQIGQRTVKAKSFVIGKKVENQTGINLIDVEHISEVQDKPFPVKVLYVKPTHERKLKKQINEDQCAQNIIINKENTDSQNSQEPFKLREIHLKKQFPVTSSVADQQKIKAQAHRPKSATSQQIKKDQIKHSKLGPNATVKPQISYIRKVQKSAPANKDSKAQQQNKQKEKSQTRKQAANQDILSPARANAQTDVPFAENRLKGQFQNITKELLQKAKEALQQQKAEQQRQREEILHKKEQQKQAAELFKKMNQELVQKQKEKGVERVDPRKKEEEQKHKLRLEENKEDRKRQQEVREKRKNEGRKALGLDIFSEDKLDEYMKQKQKENEEKLRELEKSKKIQQVIQQQQQQSKPKPEALLLKQYNKDMKQLMKDQIEEDKEDEADKKDPEELKKERQQILKLQKQKRKQQMIEEAKRQEEERKKKEENMRNLELQLKLQKEENLKRQELKLKMKEEQDRLAKELEEEEKQQKKKKKLKKPKQGASSHKEQLDELRNWIEEQMQKEEEKEYDETIKPQRMQPFQVKIDKKTSDKQETIKIEQSSQPESQQNNSYISVSQKSGSSKQKQISSKQASKQGSLDTSNAIIDVRNNNQLKQVKYELPGNSDISYLEGQKYGHRDNRYGIYGDNGYQELVEIQRRKLDDEPTITNKDSKNNESKDQEIRLSRDGLVTVIQKIQEYQKQKEQQKNLNQSMESNNENKKTKSNRVVILDQQKDLKKPEVPGVVNIEKELHKQKQEQQKKELKAVLIIQKWSRGFLDRHYVRQLREENRREIEAEYGYFEDQVKFNQEYNLKKFLKEKQKLREMSKTHKLAESDSITERIGESSSLGRSAAQASVNLNHNHLTNKQSSSQPARKNDNPFVNNFFMDNSSKDPLSLIDIFVKRNVQKVVPSVKSPIKVEQNNYAKRRSAQFNGGVDSEIEEEIYSEQFDNEEVKSHKTGGSIDEDIAIEISKGMSSGSHSKEFKQGQKQPFNYNKQGSIHESIQEEYMMSMSRSRRSPDKGDSSIAEESQLQQMSISKQSHHKRGSIAEDSIEDEVQSNYDHSYSGSGQKFSNVKKQQPPKIVTVNNQQISEFEKKMQDDQTKRKQVVSELLDEMKRYEQASVSTVVVERMEKIIHSSLAQKDKILLAQRLHELEMEKNHKDEINRIREEQIKLMSQLMLLGSAGGAGVQQNMTEDQRQQILENIDKIVNKPIIIEKKKPSSDGSDKAGEFEEKDEVDYIQESKSLSKKFYESIPEDLSEHKDSIEDDIAVEIEAGSDTHSEQSEDEIKESVYVDGMKQSDKKQPSKELSKMRMAMGSENVVREQSKKVLKGEKNSLKNSSGLFDKHSFQEFTSHKFQQLMFDEHAASTFIDEVEKVIETEKHKEEKQLKADLKRNLISPRAFKKKEQELEKWVNTQRKELHIKKQKMVQTYGEVTSYIQKLQSEKKIMLEQIGSPRVKKSLMDSQSSSLDYEEIESESNESVRIKNARKQLKNLTNQQSQHEDPQQMEIKRKKAAAKKLFDEKERAIQEGLKGRMKEIESQQVDNMLNLALGLDVQSEIEKRLQRARRALEESSEAFESARSFSHSVATTEQEPKKKKNVKFASPEQRYSSYDQSSDGQSSKVKSSRYEESNDKDDIAESIKIEESYNMSSSIPVEGSKKSQSNDRQVVQSFHTLQESIKESVAEDNESSQYSDDFVAQSQLSQSQQNQTLQSQQKLTTKLNDKQSQQLVTESVQEDDIGYSMNFDEDSVGQSQQQLFNSINKMQKKLTQDEVKEVHSDLEEEKDEYLRSQTTSNKIKESDSNEIQEEPIDASESIGGTSSKFQSSAQNQDMESMDVVSEDKEVIYSTKSVEWQINLDAQQLLESQRSKKTTEDDYQDDFEQLEEQLEEEEEEKKEESKKDNDDEEEEEDDLDDLQSFPDEIASSFDEFQMKVDKITDEFMELLMDEIRENQNLNLNLIPTEEEFKDKFPFNQEEEEEEEKVMAPVIKVDTKINNQMEEEQKKDNKDEQARQNYEKDLKKQQDIISKAEKYLDFLISNVNRQDLIDSLEKPIEVDPLKKLAFIFSQESHDDSKNLNDTNHEAGLLSLDFYVKLEKIANINEKVADLSESAKQSYFEKENIIHKALFDAFNQALDLERPYKDKGKPAPWSKQTRVLKPRITNAQVESILKKSKDRVIQWQKTYAGTNLVPPPPPPPSNDDYNHQPSQQNTQNDEERRNTLREEKLGQLMMKELEENEQKWIDYEDEDTQVKFDLADMILEELAGELAGLMLNKLGNRR